MLITTVLWSLTVSNDIACLMMEKKSVEVMMKTMLISLDHGRGVTQNQKIG